MAITFASGFENGILYRDTGLANTWMHHQFNTSPDRIQLVTSPVRFGTNAIRVEVRPGDVISGGERSELVYMANAIGQNLVENLSSETQYYAISVFIPTDWTPPQADRGNLWGCVLQLHDPDSYGKSPSFTLDVTDSICVWSQVGDIDTNPPNTKYTLSDGSLNLGRWSDFIFKIKYSIDNTGEIQVWRRNEGASSFASVLSLSGINTLQYRAGVAGDHYWKTGYYRPPQTTVINVLYLDCHTRGSSFNEVVQSAYGGVPMATTIPLSGISSGNTPTTPVSITAVATNPALFSSIVVNYTDPNPTGNIVLTPVPDANGITNVTVTVDNHQPRNNLLTRVFSCNVKKINPPSLDVIPDVIMFS